MPWRLTNSLGLAVILLLLPAHRCAGSTETPATSHTPAPAVGENAIMLTVPGAAQPEQAAKPSPAGDSAALNPSANADQTRNSELLASADASESAPTHGDGPATENAPATESVTSVQAGTDVAAQAPAADPLDTETFTASLSPSTVGFPLTFTQSPAELVSEQEQLMFLDVEVNGVGQGTTLLLADAAGQVFATAETLNDWGVKPPYPAAVEHAGRRFHEFSAIPGVLVAMESSSMSAEVSIPPQYMSNTTLSLSRDDAPAPVSDAGAFVDYQAAYTDDGGANARLFSSVFEPTMFTPQGTLNSGLLYRWSDYDYRDFEEEDYFDERDDPIEDGWIRLDSTWTRDDPDKIRTFKIGDTITPQSSWARSVRFGGIQLATNFATRPSMVTFPRPSFSSSSAVPTALDLYVNGNLRSRQNFPDGTFRIDDIPVVNGAGQIEVVTRDLLGRETTVTQDFYASDQLLLPGLNDYALNAGFLRKNYAVKSNDYGDPYASAILRRGIRENLTVDGRLETTDETVVAGAGAVFSLNRYGTFSASAAFSGGDDSGALWRIGQDYRGRKYRFSSQLQGTSSGFTQPGLDIDSGLPKLRTLLGSGVSLGGLGSIGLTLVNETFHRDEDSRTVMSASYSRTLPSRIAFSFSASYVEQDGSDLQASLLFSKSLGPRRSTSAALNLSDDDSNLRLDFRHDLPSGPGYGYRLTSYSGDSEGVESEASLNTAAARYRGQVRHRDGEYGWRAEMTGSLAWLDGETYANREIRDGFAVIDTGGYSGVTVFQENREIGVTDKRGRLLVPNLRPYQANRLHIAAEDLPLNARTSSYSAVVAPYYRSGVLIDLGVRPAQAAILRVVDAAGEPVPEGAQAGIADTPERYPVGLGGRLYIEGLGENSRVVIRHAGAECEIELPRPDPNKALPDLGEFICDGL